MNEQRELVSHLGFETPNPDSFSFFSL
jgi:hypothetical protein